MRSERKARRVVVLFLSLFAIIAAFASCEADSATNPTQQPPIGWNWADLGSDQFSIALPSGWAANPQQGVDSFIGEIRGDGVVLSWDLGWYSSDLPFDDDPSYQITIEEISGREAKLVRSIEHGAAGVFFPLFKGGDPDGPSPTRLTIYGEGLEPHQIETAFQMFRTIG
jgi:hypothetical protein